MVSLWSRHIVAIFFSFSFFFVFFSHGEALARGSARIQRTQLLFLLKVRRMAALEELTKFARQAHFISFRDFSILRTFFVFLKGNVGRAMGFDWNKGGSVACYVPLYSGHSRHWLSAYLLPPPVLGDIDLFIRIPLSGSMIFSFSLRRFLKMAKILFSEGRRGGYALFWLPMQGEGQLLIAVNATELLVRFFVPHGGKVRGNKWRQKAVQTLLLAFQRRSFLEINYKLETELSSSRDFKLWLRVPSFIDMISRLAFLDLQHVHFAIRRLEEVYFAVTVQQKEFVLDEIQPFSHFKVLSKQGGSVEKLLNLLPKQVDFVGIFPLKDLFSHRDFVFSHLRFFSELLSRWEVMFWRQMGGRRFFSLGDRFFRRFILEYLLGGRGLFFIQGHSSQRAAMVGVLREEARSLLLMSLEKEPNVRSWSAFWASPLFSWMDKGGKPLFLALEEGYWILTNDFSLYFQLAKRVKGQEIGSFQKELASWSLLHLRLWDADWNFVYLRPHRLNCCWLNCAYNPLFWRVFRKIRLLEGATLERGRKRLMKYRVVLEASSPKVEKRLSCRGWSSFWRDLEGVPWRQMRGSFVVELWRILFE